MNETRSRMSGSRGSGFSRRVVTAWALCVCVLIVAIGVMAWLYPNLWPFDTRRSVRGVIVQVDGASIVFAERVTLRGDDGVTQSFLVDPEVATNRDEPQSASHLRQHMVLGDPVIVRFHVTDDGPVALRIVDAD